MVTLGRGASITKWVEQVFKTAKEMHWEGMEPEERARFLGDSLELLTEYLMKVNVMGNKQGLLNYKPVPLRDDYGVDALGMKNDVQIVVQCKYRHNPQAYITYSALARTFTHGVLKYGLNPSLKKNIWLVTTGAGANTNCQKILGQRLHVLNRDHLKRQLDGNIDFWCGFLMSAKSK
jgi:hypothetical protein